MWSKIFGRSRRTRRVRLNVSRRAARVVFAGLVAWSFITGLCIAGIVYYRRAYLEAEVKGMAAASVEERVGGIASKLSTLENSVNHTQYLADLLEKALGLSGKGMRKGIGPVSEDEDLPIAEPVTSLRRYKLNSLEQSEKYSSSFDGLELAVDELGSVVDELSMRLTDVYEFHQDRLVYWSSMPSIWPVRGWVTSNFGPRRLYKGRVRFHAGLDIAANLGTPVVASGDGSVLFVGYKPGLGRTVILDHGYGITTIYGHNSRLLVKAGDRVKRGDNIAKVGRSGRATGPHLHYEVVVDGVPTDPMQYILERI